MNVFQYVTPVFFSIGAFGVLLGSNMKHYSVPIYFASMGSILVYHYCQELLFEIELSIIDRYYDKNIMKRVNFISGFKATHTKFLYCVGAATISTYVIILFFS